MEATLQLLVPHFSPVLQSASVSQSPSPTSHLLDEVQHVHPPSHVQLDVSFDDPEQELPPLRGAGLLQDLLLVFFPPLSHVLQDPQPLQLPLTGAEYNKLNMNECLEFYYQL